LLIPTDFSEHSKKALGCLRYLKDAGAEEVTFIHVIDLNKVVGVASGVDISAIIENYEKESYEHLEEIAHYASELKLKANYISPIPVGSPVDEIVKHASEYDAIVMASRGKGVISELLLGSVSEGVVRRSPIPVLVVKDHCENLFDKILFCFDFSDLSREMISHMKEFAIAGGKEVVLLHVLESDEELSEEKLEELKNIEKELENSGINCYMIIGGGVPYKEILKVADEENVTLITLASVGHGFASGLLMGSVAESVVRRSKVPVFVFKK
jgi:nucleotide-binding universal stress UspA family protein